MNLETCYNEEEKAVTTNKRRRAVTTSESKRAVITSKRKRARGGQRERNLWMVWGQ